MLTVGFLILFPMLAALVLLFVTGEGARRAITLISAVVIGVGSILLACQYLGAGQVLMVFSSRIVDIVCVAVDVVLSCVVIAYGVRYKRKSAIVLAVVQLICTALFEIFFAGHADPVECSLYVDGLSIIMALIIGIIGSGICVYALGYMEDFQEHEPEGARDRRPTFFALMFLFLGAMFLIVLSNNMSWMLTGWEITTVCSFLLIGYTKTDEAIANSFRQILMNMLGGIAFSAALMWSAGVFGTLDFAKFIELGTAYPAYAMVALTCLALAGLTKAAQMPFHTWLLGAMVAPTPTSALLHSSTMVKAGVFLLIKLAPCFAACTAYGSAIPFCFAPGYLVMMVGGITFLLCSCMAISQTNAKRVLAYSTIANLGLICACAGVGTDAAVWAAIFLVIFHAAAKSLLFLCVGTAEHHIGSRNIEDMDNLFIRMPKLAKFMILGILCMFIAPFGMLLAKWAALASFIESSSIILITLLAFGSAATFMFWGKWIGKLSGIAQLDDENVEGTVHKSEWGSIGLMAALAALCCVLLPLISSGAVVPYLVGVFGYADPTLSSDNLWLMSIVALFVIIVLFGAGARPKSKRKVDVYLAGSSVDNAARTYVNSLSGETQATARNWYLDGWFGEGRLRRLGELVCTALIVAAFLAIFIAFFLGM